MILLQKLEASFCMHRKILSLEWLFFYGDKIINPIHIFGGIQILLKISNWNNNTGPVRLTLKVQGSGFSLSAGEATPFGLILSSKNA